jgi:hypothetical protein
VIAGSIDEKILAAVHAKMRLIGGDYRSAMKLPAVLSEGFLRTLPIEERRKLGRAGMTAAEASATFKRG